MREILPFEVTRGLNDLGRKIPVPELRDSQHAVTDKEPQFCYVKLQGGRIIHIRMQKRQRVKIRET